MQPGDQLLDQDIKRAVDEQLAGKGLRRVEGGGDLYVGYQASISEEKQFDSLSWGGPRWWGSLARHSGNDFDHRNRQAGYWDVRPGCWKTRVARLRGQTLDIKEDPDKNYRNLEKAMAKLFKNYPPAMVRASAAPKE